jgi:hypothetical protein
MRKRDMESALGDRIRELAKRFCGPPHYLIGRGLWITTKHYDYRRL